MPGGDCSLHAKLPLQTLVRGINAIMGSERIARPGKLLPVCNPDGTHRRRELDVTGFLPR